MEKILVTKFRNFFWKIPEFRDSEKTGNSGNPEIGISGIAIAIYVQPSLPDQSGAVLRQTSACLTSVTSMRIRLVTKATRYRIAQLEINHAQINGFHAKFMSHMHF